MRRPFGPREGNRYFVAGAGRKPRPSLASDRGGRRPRPRAAGAAGIGPAAPGPRPVERRLSARGGAEALGRGGLGGAGRAPAARVSPARGPRGGGGASGRRGGG